MQSNAQLAAKITNLSSSLKGSIALSIGMTLAGKVFGLTEKHAVLLAAQAKTGRQKINPETGKSVEEELAIVIENMAGYYAAALDAFPEQQYIVTNVGSIIGFSPEAYATNKATPYVKTMTDDELAVVAKAGGISKDAVRVNQYKAAEIRADAFSRKAPALLAEVECHVAMAPTYDLADIPEDVVEFHAKVEEAIKKYRAKVAAGQKWDAADMVLFNDDVEYLALD